jgi:hypothetical protein
MTRYHHSIDGNIPFTAEEEAEYDARITSFVTNQRATQYQRDRAAEYPTIGDQLDALFKAGVFPADMAATIQAVKNKYPKG